MIAELKRLLTPILARARNAAQRRALAQALHELAAQLDALAEADDRVGHQVRRVALDAQAARQRTGRPMGSGARFLRWEPPHGEGKASRRSGHLHIGRALWQELGEPARFRVERLGAQLVLRPCVEPLGWAVSRPTNGMPRLNIGQAPADQLGLVAGRYPAEIQGGAIVAAL